MSQKLNEDLLARQIFEFVKPNNPHGPRSDLMFGDHYCESATKLSKKIAKSINENISELLNET